VEVMQKELQDLQPVLTSTAEEVERMMTVIAADKEEAAVTKAKVEQQEREANVQAATAKSIAGRTVNKRALYGPQTSLCTVIGVGGWLLVVWVQGLARAKWAARQRASHRHGCLCCVPHTEDAQKDLDAALPALDAAVASLKNLSRNDVVEVKSLSNPPAGVKLVMEVTCIMFDEKPKMKDDPNKMGE
jgi:dynein heavy chain